jgi:asparagine synthase (glutamine-hydrolysing)
MFDTRDRRDIPRDIAARMNDVQFHRGPDGGDIHFEPGVALAHRRLAIIDVGGGHQPLFNEDGSVVVVFNGEIYNFQALVPELEAAGHRFATHSDTEVIVHAWEQWGEACVQRFRGMFAFALWDRNRQTLFVARDRLGVKPFFYALLPDGMFVFGSELKALMQHPQMPRAVEPECVEEYFALGYVPEPRTIYRGVMKLDAGHTLTLRRGEPFPASREYWDVRFSLDAKIGAADAERELIERLRESIRLRMIAEVPLGAFLSGGVDSSAVVAMMAGLSPTPVKTCSIGFDDPRFNETEFASQVAQRYRTDHRVETVASDDFGLIDSLARLYDEPYADSSAIPTWRVCEIARRRVTVALSGDGGDETFGGYGRYRRHLAEERLRGLFPPVLRRGLFGPLARLYPKADWAPRPLRAKTTFQAIARTSVDAYFNQVSILRGTQRHGLYSDGFRRTLAGYDAVEVFRRHAGRSGTEDALALIQYLDTKTYLVGDINTKVDRASMAHSLEVREPLMDHELVEWMATLPSALKIRGSEGKWLFKKSLEPHLSQDVLYRPKMGFAVPLARWFRGPLKQRVRDALTGPVLLDSGLFDAGALLRLVDQHQLGRHDHSAPIWTLMMFDAFLRKDAERASSIASPTP